MHPYSTLDISMSDIKLFTLLAQERNFSRVATMVGLTQPTLSRRISQMESQLGVRLFDRGSRPVALSGEGTAFYLACQPILSQFEAAVLAARASARDRHRSIAVGTPDSTNEVVSLPSIARSVFQDHPDMGITMRYLPLSAWRSLVLIGEIDVFITALFETCDLPEPCAFEQLTVCSKDVVMLASNPLARQEAIRFEDLKNQRFVMTAPDESPAYGKYLASLFKRHGGYTPALARYVPHATNLIAGILHDDEVVVCDMFLRDVNNATHKRFSLPGVYSGLVAVYLKDNPNPNIAPFLASLRRYFADAGFELFHTM
ncbi:MAG: LysR family transcriptional regulator [Clostridia bacterium]|nr:LysR family transcriptional regulator [Clostridia bacterium]